MTALVLNLVWLSSDKASSSSSKKIATNDTLTKVI